MTKSIKTGFIIKTVSLLIAIVFQSQTNLFAQSPKADFTQDKTTGCVPLIIQFADGSAGSIASYAWDFGNGNTSILKNPGVIYTKAGSYTVKLVVTDGSGNKDSIIKNIAVQAFANPVAGFVSGPNTGCEGQEVKFTDTTKTAAPIASWLWNFGDGSTSAQKNPNHTYTLEGSFAVSLIVTDINGCKSFVNNAGHIKIGKPAVPAFTSNSTGGCTAPLSVNFTNNSQLQPGKTYTYLWHFGNGDSAVTENPSSTFGAFGEYNVSLTVKDNLNCAVSTTVNKFISIGKTVANFTTSGINGCAPYKVDFTNASIGLAGNATVKWYFGNGDSATGKDASYTYTTPGIYAVKMVITSPDGCNDEIEKPGFIIVNPAAKSDFSYTNPNSCATGHTVNFTGYSLNNIKWEWDFGDGDTSTVKNPVKKYNTAGVFAVSLTTTDINGCKATLTRSNVVKIKTQKAAFSPSVNVGCVPLQVTFTNYSTSSFPISKYSWRFGDGQTSTAVTPAITISKPGTYRPRLIITDTLGCTDTVVYDSVMVGEKTNPNFFADKTQGCQIDMRRVQFTNTTNMNGPKIQGFYWEFGAPPSSTAVNPEVDYLVNPGKYTVRLISFSNGCADTMVKVDYITIFTPEAQAIITEDPCKLDTVVFTDNSIGGNVFQWSLNGQTVSNSSGFRMFLSPGIYNFQQKVTDTKTGCVSTKDHRVAIRKPIAPGFVISQDSICANVPFLIQDTTQGAVSYLWKYNGNQFSTDKNPAGNFSNPGFYTISLTATDAFGCVEEAVNKKTIKILGPDFTPVVTPDKGCFPLDAQLTMTGTSAHGVKQFVWSDGSTDITTTSSSIPFTFDKIVTGMNTGGVQVYLTAEDMLGCKVARPATAYISKPVAIPAWNITNNCDNTQLGYVHSTAQSMHYGALDFTWSTTDTTYSGPIFTTKYSKSGSYKVKLVVTEPALGCTDSSETTVPVVVKKLKAGFSVDNTHTTCPPLVSNFISEAEIENSSLASVQWFFGDGSSSSMDAPVKNYFFPGNYDITYKITDVDGCSDSITLNKKIFVGGPVGEYVIDRYTDCIPFDVNFSTINTNAKYVKWDMGNGTIGTTFNSKTTYTAPGTFQPSMVLEDSLGCVVVYPVKDPIVGLLSPLPSFEYSGKCQSENFIFTNTTDSTQNLNYVWRFSDDSVTTVNATHKFNDAGTYKVTLKATGGNGCQAEAVKNINIKKLKVAFSTDKNPVCRFDNIQATDLTVADAGITEWLWSFGDGQTSTVQNPVITYTTPGSFDLTLTVKDANGCLAANSLPGIVVFDTLAPPAPWAHRVTVEESNSIRLEFAANTGTDFTSYAIYRSTPAGSMQLYKEITNRLDTVLIDSNVKTNDFSYTYKVYSKTFCDKISAEVTSRAHTSVLLQGISDTNAVKIQWNSYGGWDNVKAYHVFRMSQDEKSYTQVATVPGTDTAYNDVDVYCGFTYRYFVQAQNADVATLLSRSNNITVAPFHKPTVQPGEIIRATVEDDKNVWVEFACAPQGKAPIVSYTLEKSSNGFAYDVFYKSDKGCLGIVDKNVDVHASSYYYRVRTTDLCGDVSVPSNVGKTILLDATTNNDDNVDVSWSAYQQWNEGIKSYEVELMDATGNFVKAGDNSFNDTTYTDATNTFNDIASACFRVKAVSTKGIISYSNTDCAKGRSSLFVPNAFTPNSDELNTTFTIVGAYIKKFEMTIYNRHGEEIFTTGSLDNTWNGTYQGLPVPQGVYIYVINALGMDNKYHNLSGSITVLR